MLTGGSLELDLIDGEINRHESHDAQESRLGLKIGSTKRPTCCSFIPSRGISAKIMFPGNPWSLCGHKTTEPSLDI